MSMEFERKATAQDVPAEIAGGARFLERLLESVVNIPDLAVDIVVAGRASGRVGGDRHALDHDVRVVAQDVAVLERARLASSELHTRYLSP